MLLFTISFLKKRGELRGEIFGEPARVPAGLGGSSSRRMCSRKVRTAGSAALGSPGPGSAPDMASVTTGWPLLGHATVGRGGAGWGSGGTGRGARRRELSSAAEQH